MSATCDLGAVTHWEGCPCNENRHYEEKDALRLRVAALESALRDVIETKRLTIADEQRVREVLNAG